MRRGVWLLAAMIVLGLPVQAHAAFPGQNGRIAFHANQDGDYEIYSVNPDGTGLLKLTDNTVEDFSPSWSPDGQQILFRRGNDPFGGPIWKMNADGSGQAEVLNTYANTPSWSPDGQKIAFSLDDHCFYGGLWIANADGSTPEWHTCGFDDGACCTSWAADGTRIIWSEDAGPGIPNIWQYTIGDGTTDQLTDDDYSFYPDWSPSLDKILFTRIDRDGVLPDELRTMNPDGSNQVPLRQGRRAVWSPDGTKIAFVDGSVFSPSMYVMGADGSGATFLANGDSPSWQPIPINSYVRPGSANQTRFSLLPAYQQCVSSNRTHGSPLAHPSCNPPVAASPYLTVATSESNGAAAALRGHLRVKNLSGNPAAPPDEADAQIDVSVDDIRCNGNAPSPPSTCGAANQSSNPAVSFPDYTGELDAVVFVRITDKQNNPHPGGPGAATVEDFDLHFPAACTGTASTALGSDCSTTTTVESLLPGAITEGRRNVWALDRVHVRDGGSDGDADTPGNRIFLRPGLFVP